MENPGKNGPTGPSTHLFTRSIPPWAKRRTWTGSWSPPEKHQAVAGSFSVEEGEIDGKKNMVNRCQYTQHILKIDVNIYPSESNPCFFEANNLSFNLLVISLWFVEFVRHLQRWIRGWVLPFVLCGQRHSAHGTLVLRRGGWISRWEGDVLQNITLKKRLILYMLLWYNMVI